MRLYIFIAVCALALSSRGQSIRLEPADPIQFGGIVDSNSPAYWDEDTLYVFNSVSLPIRTEADVDGHFGRTRAVFISGENRWRWIESVWRDDDGTVYAWYHAELSNVCPGKTLAVPEIGALVSSDGLNFTDLGVIIRAGDVPNCSAGNQYFAGGHGDFSVILDQDRRFFYFLFTNYGGAPESQGIGIARLAFADRANPAGRVWKFFQDDWREAGIDGRLTPVFTARSGWESDSPDAYWGPSVHWNTSIQRYVVLMSHAADSTWAQAGIYYSFNTDIANPTGWTAPAVLLEPGEWYPQVLGMGFGETDSLAGDGARLFISGHSEWQLIFEGSAPVGDSSASRPKVKNENRNVRPRSALYEKHKDKGRQ